MNHVNIPPLLTRLQEVKLGLEGALDCGLNSEVSNYLLTQLKVISELQDVFFDMYSDISAHKVKILDIIND